MVAAVKKETRLSLEVLASAVGVAVLETHVFSNFVPANKLHRANSSRLNALRVCLTWIKCSGTHQDRSLAWWENMLEPTVYLYDGMAAGANVIEEVDSSGNVLARYAQGLGTDEPLSMLRAGTTSYYAADALGSITSMSNSSARIANTYTYDSFGKLTASAGTLTNPFQYTGREFDQETSLYEYRARYYDQNAGRFSSEDPIRGSNGPNRSPMDDSANLYVYVLNNPVNYVDPSGLYILKPGVPAPTGALAALLTCAENCLGSILTITSTSEPIPQHPRNSPHGRGEAADMRSPSNVSKLLCCLSQCGAGFALDEAAHPSAHATGPHVHAQTGPGRNGGRGDLPPAKQCKDCQ